MLSAFTITKILAILIASTIHEYAHAYTAHKLGDITPKVNGRLTLNPLSHIDPIGTLSLLIFKFGWSKPVPITPYNFQNPTRDTAIASLAGPTANILCSFFLSTIHFVVNIFSPETASNLLNLLVPIIVINSTLALFNLIPIAPLDGFKIVSALVPNNLRYEWESLEKYGVFLLLMFLIPISPLYPIFSNIFSTLLIAIIQLSLF